MSEPVQKPVQKDAPTPSIALPDGGGQWALWSCVCLRGAGFPAADVLRLAAPRAAAAADRLRAAEAEAEQRRDEALAALSREIDRAGKSALDGLVKAVQKLKKGKLPVVADLPEAARPAVERAAAAREAAGRLAAEYLDVFAAEAERLSGELAEVARDGRFREAVLWQNRHVLKTGIDHLSRRPAGGRSSSKERQHEQVVASYLQRFCTKNDTIGFFGPVGWATLTGGDEAIAVHHGPDFLDQRRVFFEGWSVDAVAAALAADPDLRLGLAPRRRLFVSPTGELTGPAAGGQAPAPEQRAVLAGADGETPARDLAARLVAAGTFPDAPAVYAALDALRAAGLLTWGFNLPVVLAPERALKQQVERLEAGAARDAALRTLEELEALRQAVAEAAGDERALDDAFERLESRFTELTGLGSTRGHGETYAGRTLVYEDCRRGTTVDLGAEVLAALAPPMSLLLASSRWLTWASAELHRELFDVAYRELRQETGASRIDLVTFCRKVLPTLMVPDTSPVRQQVLPQFRQRWAEVFDIQDDGARQVSYTSDELAPRVARAFDAPRPGWPLARQHCPDLLIAASGPEAIRRGDYRLVLGEMHVATNTLATNLFVAQYPTPRDMVFAMRRDMPEPCVWPLLPKVWQEEEVEALLGVSLPGLTGRLDFGLGTGKDFFLDLGVTPPPVGLPASQVLSVLELAIEPGDGGGLQVVNRDGSRRFDLFDFLQTVITAQIAAAFKIFRPQAHIPRVTIDRLIVWRESWMVKAAGLEFARAAGEAQRFSGARRWADHLGLPRFVFVKAPHERKPFFLDLESPPSVEIFSHEARRAVEKSQGRASLSLSEMVPGPDEAWLPDAQDRRYTSELRMIAVDLSG